MSPVLHPTSVAELAEAVRAHPAVLAVGAGTKPRLAETRDGCVGISTRKLSRLVEYEPDEFTFTALAGTPLAEVTTALTARGQYLPFDPPLAGAGATLGGTVAAGLSGPGRFRYGGLRDFILGVRFVDGEGRILRLGGKVVKNAAGFDLPKFFVGSLGRFGILAELTFKVFPRPPALLTLRLPIPGAEAAVAIFAAVGRARWEVDAADLGPDGEAVLLRLAGPAGALPDLAKEILGRWPGEVLAEEAATRIWDDLAAFRWSENFPYFGKALLTPAQLPGLLGALKALGGRAHVSAGSNVAYLALPAGADPAGLGRPVLTLRGAAPLWIRPASVPAIAAAVKFALDPSGRFPALA